MNNITRTLVATCALIALSPVAPAAAMPHHIKNIRTPHIYRAQQRNIAPNIHHRVAAFNDQARKQISNPSNSWRYVSHCAGNACTYVIHY